MKQAFAGLMVALAITLPAVAHTGAGTAVHNEGRRLRQQISNGLELAMKKATLHGHASATLLKHNSSNTSHGKSHSLANSTSMKNKSTAVHNDSKNVVVMADHMVHKTINRTSLNASGKMLGKKVAFMQFTMKEFAKKAFTKKAVKNENDKDMSDDEDDDDDDDDDMEGEQKDEEPTDEPSIRALRKNVSRLDGLVDINVHDQRQLESEIKYLDDKDASAEEIQSSTAKVVNETSSPALGRILRKMWSEMRMYAWPFYQEHLEDNLKDLKNEEQQLQTQLTTAEEKLEKAEKAEKEEKEEKEDKRKKKEVDGKKDAEEEDKEGKKEKKEKKDESNEEKSREKKEKKQGDKDTDKEKEDEDDDEDDETRAVVVVPVSPSPSGTWSPAPASAPASAAKMSVKKRAIKKQKPEYEPLFTEETMPAISPTLKCVLVLVFQFFITYTVHAIFRTMNQFGNQKYWNLQRIAEEVCRTITYAPALSVLFLATRMRAIQLSGGETEKYELPPFWVQLAMYVCTFSLPVQAITVLVSASMQPADEMAKKAFKNSKKVQDPEEGAQLSAAEEAKQQKLKCSNPGEMDTDQVQPVTLGQVSKNNGLQIAMTVLTSLCLIAMYGGVAVVCVGALMMEGPKELWKKAAMLLQGKPGEPPVSTTLTCTMILVTTFFIVYLSRTINRIILDLTPEPKTPKTPKEPKSPRAREVLGVKLNWIFTHAQESVSLAPMLCVLFIAIRMRALQVNPQTGNPQIWARHCMVASVVLLIIKVLAVIILPLCDAKTSAGKLGSGIGEEIFPFKRRGLKITAAIIKHASVLLIVVCAVVIRAGIFLIQSPEGPDKTPHVSPAVLNVITLCDLFFVAHAVIYVMQTMTDAFPMKKLVHLIAGIAEAGHKAVMYAPMLAVLYLGCRMRALQLTRTIDGEVPPTAGPQFWAQEAMYVATFALLVRMLCSYLDAALRGSGNTIPQDFSETTQLRDSSKMSIAVVVGNYVSLFVMYTAAIVIMVGIFIMTPETLPPYSTQ